jgi:hypothetical protein
MELEGFPRTWSLFDKSNISFSSVVLGRVHPQGKAAERNTIRVPPVLAPRALAV